MEEKELQRHFAALRAGDKQAFAPIYEALRTPVYTVIYRITLSRAAAEDAMQDVFLKLFQEPPAPSVKNLRAWVFRVARNRALDTRRKKQAAELKEDTALWEEPDTALRLDLERALARLAPAEREMLALHLTAGLTFREAAAVTGLSPSAAYRLYEKALRTLRSILNGGTL